MLVMHGETLWSPALQPMDDDDDDDDTGIQSPRFTSDFKFWIGVN